MTNSTPQHLSNNLQSLRKKRAFSQEKLSKISDIPRSTITHMESGEGNPSLSNLCKVSAALGVSIEELLSPPRNDCQLIRKKDLAVISKGAGKVKINKLMPDKVKGIEIDRMHFKGNSVLGGHPHLSGTKEYLFILEGQMKVFLEGQSYTLEQGDLLAFPGEQKHSYKNSQTKNASAISVVIPIPHLLA